MIRGFRKINADGDIAKLQDNVEYVLEPIIQSSIIDGVQLNNVEVLPTDTRINHGLGRTPQGYIVVDRNANLNVWTVSLGKQTMVLRSASPVTVSLWIY